MDEFAPQEPNSRFGEMFNELIQRSIRCGELETALRETTRMLDEQAQKVFVMGVGHRHWESVQTLIDANYALLNAPAPAASEDGAL